MRNVVCRCGNSACTTTNCVGNVEFVWAGNNNKYFARVKYWIGVGFQKTEKEVTKAWYDAFREFN